MYCVDRYLPRQKNAVESRYMRVDLQDNKIKYYIYNISSA